MKTDAVYKRAFNEVLDLVVDLGDGAPLPSENGLSAQLGVSRTTVRKTLSGLDAGPGREALHGVDAAGRCRAWNQHQRTGSRPAVRRGDHRHSRVPQPLP